MRYGSFDYECKTEQLFYNSNKAQLQNPMIVSIFDIPIIIFIYECSLFSVFCWMALFS